VIVNPDFHEKYCVVFNREKFLGVEGVLQNRDDTTYIKASRALLISTTAVRAQAGNFR
jgi:hypothetical protein